MASKEEIRLVRAITGMAMEITAQGKYNVQAEYHGHVDSFCVWVAPVGAAAGEYVDGWDSVERNVYLGDFYLKPWATEKGKKESAKQLVELQSGLKQFLQIDEDGVAL